MFLKEISGNLKTTILAISRTNYQVNHPGCLPYHHRARECHPMERGEYRLRFVGKRPREDERNRLILPGIEALRSS